MSEAVPTGLFITRSQCPLAGQNAHIGLIRTIPPPALKRQRGVVLIVMMLLLVVTASVVLVRKLNAAARPSYRSEQTAQVLARARDALIGYAATYPDNPATTDALAGPGFLPCPDTDDDGSPNPPCGPNAIGRLPWEFLGLDDVRDSSGERLWYALSDVFRNNPKTFPLNSETPGQLTIDGTGDIVAIVFAPGPSFDGQARPSNNAVDYLEDENTDADADFVSMAATDFNDQVLVITRRDFMAAMERRVLGEAANLLTQYRSVVDALPPAGNGRYPWLSPFADPRSATSAAPMITGTVTGGSGGNLLEDTTKDFVALGVRVDDLVQNTADGSKGVVTAVTANTLTVANLRDGIDNDFDPGEAYQIPRFNSDIISGIVSGNAREGHLPYHATVAASGTGEAFRTGFGVDWDIEASNGAAITSAFLPAIPSPVVTPTASYQPGLAAIIEATLPRPLRDSAMSITDPIPVLPANGICTWAPTDDGDPVNFPDCPATPEAATGKVDCSGTASEPFFTRTATAGSAGTTLVDGEVNFYDLGVNAGDVVENQTDGSIGFVSSVVSPTSLTVSALAGGTSNAFASDDRYRIHIATRELPVPLPGTATGGSAAVLLEDTSVDFLALGVDVGDIVRNNTSGLSGVVTSVGAPSNSHLTVDVPSGVTFNAGDTYQLFNAATAGSAGLTLVDASQDFAVLNVRAGDVVQNVTDGSIGRVAAVVGPNQLTLTGLSGGSSNSVNVGDQYVIRSGIIETRQYDFRIDYSSSATFTNSGGSKVRNVAIGVPAAGPLPPQPAIPTVTITDLDSGGVPLGNATLTIPAGGATGSMTTSNIQMDFAPLDGVAAAGSAGPMLVDAPAGLPARDFGQLGVAPGDWVENISDCSKGRVASVGPVAGQLTVISLQGGTSNIFAAGDVYRIHHELAPWFVRNNWHQFIYAAASSELVPGQPGICTAGTNCLTVNDGMTAATNNDNKQAIVISAGDSLAAIGQNRVMARIQDYYENENIDPPDATFERSAFPPIWNQFNDQIRIVAPWPGP